MNIGMLLDNEFTADPRVSNEAMMLAREHQVHVICLNYGKQKPFEKHGNLFIHRIFIPQKVKKIIFLIQFYLPAFQWFWYFNGKKIIRKYNIQAIHAHDLYMALPALMLKKAFQFPIILDLHENYPAALEAYTWAHKLPARLIFKASSWRKTEYNLLSKVDAIIVLSNAFRQHLSELYPKLSSEKILVYPNVPVLKDFEGYPVYNGQYEFMKQGFWMVYFGVIGRRRGIFTIMDALSRLNNNDIRLLMVGPVDKHDKEDFYEKLNTFTGSGQVVYYPWKDISELPSMLYYARLALSPIVKNRQHESGIANKVFQYMLVGRAILVSDCKPQVDLIEDCSCGVVYKDGDEADLIEKIDWCYRHPEELKVMGEKGRRAVLEKYNSDNQFKNIMAFYKKIEDDGQ
ncbi:MAG: glycosyltransferase family 4 protein [Bacteroidales bacterium]|nr:glycosyltransferase family 4 protein [Bacteroidales bacterium]